MNRCFPGLGAAIQEEGGCIDKYIGDNSMALFGAPIAHQGSRPRRGGCSAAQSVLVC
jgi:class 3 adenylate cyclase